MKKRKKEKEKKNRINKMLNLLEYYNNNQKLKINKKKDLINL